MTTRIKHHKKVAVLIIISVLVAALLGYVAFAYGYPAVKGEDNVTGSPQNKGEMRAYMGELKAHDDRLVVGEATNHGLWLQKLDQDRRILAGIAQLKNNCTPCVVMLGPEDPPPAFETLEELIIPEIQGADDEPVGDADRELLNRLETKHDENQNRHLRNEDKRLSYLLYIENQIEYYLDPVIKCPEPEPVVTPPTNNPPPDETPDEPQQWWKRNNAQVNPDTGASNTDPAIVDTPGSPDPEPGAEPTQPADEPN